LAASRSGGDFHHRPLLQGDRFGSGDRAVTLDGTTGPPPQWAVRLFNRSVLKQAKYRMVHQLIDDPSDKTNLDLGGDNGVISYFLRRLGGTWYSADLDPGAVASIRQLVHRNVYQVDGCRMPFSDHTFDQIVVVDMLEHIDDDRGFIAEIRRIIKPGGTLVINVPHLKPHSILNRFRHWVGLTDEWHGHRRPGYSLSGLRRLLEPDFVIEQAKTYSRVFSELVDTAMNGGYELLRRRKQGERVSSKGTVVTQRDLEGDRLQFMLLSALYPVLWMVARLDAAVPLQSGYKLIVRARLSPAMPD
jgi:SAM-dependent methyltransferase